MVIIILIYVALQILIFCYLNGYDVQHHTFIRYGLNKRKQRKPFSHTTSLVAFHPLSSEDNRRLNVCKTRTLTFVHHVYEGKEVFPVLILFGVLFVSPFFSSQVL